MHFLKTQKTKIREFRVLDIDVATALGLTRATNVRRVVANNLDEFKSHGEVCTRPVQTTDKGGRPAKAYLLNEGQAVLLCILSRTEKAQEARRVVIETFLQARRNAQQTSKPRIAAKSKAAHKTLSSFELKHEAGCLYSIKASVPFDVAAILAKTYHAIT